MPELPEVETIVRDLNKSLQGKIFADVTVHDAFLLRQQSKDFIQRLKSQGIEKITRRGKAVIVHLTSGEFLVIQLMMTGQLIFNGPEDRHTRITFDFSDGSRLLYNDQRRFGQLRVVKRLDEVKHFNILGPEPFSKEFTSGFMLEAFRKTSRPSKMFYSTIPLWQVSVIFMPVRSFFAALSVLSSKPVGSARRRLTSFIAILLKF